MKNVAAKFGVLIALACLLMPGVKASGQSQYSSSPTDALSLWQARNAIFATSKYVTVAHWGKMTAQFYSMNPGSIKITATSLEFDGVNKKGGTKHFQVDVKNLEKVSAACGTQRCDLIPAAGKIAVQDKEAIPYDLWFGWYPSASDNLCVRAENNAECMHSAYWFAAALNSLHTSAIAYLANPAFFPPTSRGVARPDDQTCVSGRSAHPPSGSRRRHQATEAGRGTQRLRTRSPGGPNVGARLVQRSTACRRTGLLRRRRRSYAELSGADAGCV